MSIVNPLKKLIFSLIYDGDCWLRDYEVQLLFSYFHILSEADRKKFYEQFKLFDNVQRGKNGKMVRFHQITDQFRTRWSKDILFTNEFGEYWSLDIKINIKNEATKFSINFGNGALVELSLKRIPIKFRVKGVVVNYF
jgi:hypothetical protein